MQLSLRVGVVLVAHSWELAEAKTDSSCNERRIYTSARDTLSELHICMCISGGLGGFPWGCKGFYMALV